jgi:hypothetical protein
MAIQILQGDALTVLRTLPAERIELVQSPSTFRSIQQAELFA